MNINDFAVKYAQCGNAYEAAVFAGASPLTAGFEGLKALAARNTRQKIARYKEVGFDCPAAAGLRRLAFGRNNDAFMLAFAETVTPEMIEQADLFGVSEIKCGKNGVEIKFFDRQKALDALCVREAADSERENAKSLICAIYGENDEGKEDKLE